MPQTDPHHARFTIGPVCISAVTMADTLAVLDRQVMAGESAYVCVANMRTTVLSRRDQTFCAIQNHSLLTLPDGMPLVWLARIAGVQNIERVTGPDLMMRVLERSCDRAYSHYFYGDTESTLTKMRKVIERRYPGLSIRGMHSPPFRPLTDEEIAETVSEISRSKPDFVWVALGAGKQERWMARAVDSLDTGIMLGVGAAFRFLTGDYRHPNPLLQRLGLEGICWRIRSDPWRAVTRSLQHLLALGHLVPRALVARILCRPPVQRAPAPHSRDSSGPITNVPT